MLHFTAKHPIWVETKQDFVSAEKLSLGDQVRLYGDTFATVASLRRVDSSLDVFNIEVENEQVYYVGVDGMLVHNSNPKGCPFDTEHPNPGSSNDQVESFYKNENTSKIRGETDSVKQRKGKFRGGAHEDITGPKNKDDGLA